VRTEIVRFGPEHVGAVRDFVERIWQRPRGDAFFRWRYLESPLLRAYLAMRGGECLATLWAFRRPYRLGSQIVHFLEVFDWYSRPELRRAGLGVRALQAAMQEPDPCILVGGTDDTRTLLPRLRWQRVDTAVRFLLPIGAGHAARALRGRARVPEALGRLGFRAIGGPWLRPRVRARPPGGRAIAVASVGPEVQALYEGPLGYGTVPLWPEPHLRWLLAGFPAAGHFVPLYFARDEDLLGWALGRVYPVREGCDAELVEVFAREPDPELYTWMVSETCVRMAGFAPSRISASTSCIALAQGLRRNRFLRATETPIHAWVPSGGELPAPRLLGSNANDNPLLPFAERWW
jgi:hypothetical protein